MWSHGTGRDADGVGRRSERLLQMYYGYGPVVSRWRNRHQVHPRETKTDWRMLRSGGRLAISLNLRPIELGVIGPAERERRRRRARLSGVRSRWKPSRFDRYICASVRESPRETSSGESLGWAASRKSQRVKTRSVITAHGTRSGEEGSGFDA